MQRNYTDVCNGDREREEDKILPISQCLDTTFELELTLRSYDFNLQCLLRNISISNQQQATTAMYLIRHNIHDL